MKKLKDAFGATPAGFAGRIEQFLSEKKGIPPTQDRAGLGLPAVACFVAALMLVVGLGRGLGTLHSDSATAEPPRTTASVVAAPSPPAPLWQRTFMPPEMAAETHR